MSLFPVRVHAISAVREHPGADNLTIVTVGDTGVELVANKKADGSWRYQPGDLAVFFPEGAVIPEATLRQMGYWDEAKGKGVMAGSKGNRVKMRRLADFPSPGALLKVERQHWPEVGRDAFLLWSDLRNEGREVAPGEDVQDFLGVTEYVPQ